ncbi:hypothetical protein DSECCO2_624450 [anaerobic digester metagenome]
MDITNDPKFEYFIQTKPRKTGTQIKYARDLKLYVRCIGKSLEELVNEAREEQLSRPWMDGRSLPKYFNNFINFLEERGITPYSQKLAIATVKHFYKTFEVDCPSMTVDGVPENYYILYEDLPQFYDLRRLISVSNSRYRALFSFMSSSAMNYSDATSISVRELILAVNYFFKITKQETRVNDLDGLYELRKKKVQIIPVWRMWRIKTSKMHITFSSSESLNFILDYFKEHPPLYEEVPIFRTHRTQETMKYNSVNKYLAEKNKKLGWNSKRIGTYHYVTSKTFRTFFANEMEDEEIFEKHIRAMMGHKFPGVTQNYFKANVVKMLKSYLKGVHRLTFLEEVTVIDNTDVIVKEMEEKYETSEQKREEERERHLEKEREWEEYKREKEEEAKEFKEFMRLNQLRNKK